MKALLLTDVPSVIDIAPDRILYIDPVAKVSLTKVCHAEHKGIYYMVFLPKGRSELDLQPVITQAFAKLVELGILK